MPNIDPSNQPNPIFDPSTGAIENASLLGWTNLFGGGPLLYARCQNNCGALPGPQVWRFYPADPSPTNFPPPGAASVSCAGSAGFTAYQLSVAGCVPLPIACNSSLSIDVTPYPTRDSETSSAVNCLSHSAANQGDSVDPASVPPQPFQFLAGADNPVVQSGSLAPNTDVLVSDSIVTVPVVNAPAGAPNVANPAQVIGFVQLFLNPDGNATAPTGRSIETTVLNIAGCGTGAAGQPILGNGASPVPVRLITPP